MRANVAFPGLPWREFAFQLISTVPTAHVLLSHHDLKVRTSHEANARPPALYLSGDVFDG